MRMLFYRKVFKSVAMITVFAIVFCGLLVTTTIANPGDFTASRDTRFSLAAATQAQFICSSVFIAGRTVQDVLEEELPYADGDIPGTSRMIYEYEPRVYYRDRYVSVRFSEYEEPRIAAYREGLGCIVLPAGKGKEFIAELPQAKLDPPVADQEQVPWPDGDLIPEQLSVSPDVDLEKISNIVEAAFDSEHYGIGTVTNGVVIVHKGQIIAELYRPGWDKDTQYRTWSTAKSIANAIIGVAIQQGIIGSVNDRVPIPEWQGPNDPRKEITFNNLMHMSSGLETVDPVDGSVTTRGYWGGIDSAADATSLPLVHEPETVNHYSNYDALLSMRSLRLLLNDDEKYLFYPRKNLFFKIGMLNTVAEVDSYGNFIMSSDVYTTPRDLARFGLLYLNDGVWNGERILPEGWVKYTTTPAPTSKNSRYGAFWWLYNPSGYKNSDLLPDNVFHTSGWRGQICAVVPSHDLVIVRTGIDVTGEFSNRSFRREQFIADICSAINVE